MEAGAEHMEAKEYGQTILDIAGGLKRIEGKLDSFVTHEAHAEKSNALRNEVRTDQAQAEGRMEGRLDATIDRVKQLEAQVRAQGQSMATEADLRNMLPAAVSSQVDVAIKKHDEAAGRAVRVTYGLGGIVALFGLWLLLEEFLGVMNG